MRRLLASLLAAAIALPSAAPVAAQEFNYEGWWVVLASFKDPDYDSSDIEPSIRKVYAKAEACGLEAFHDFSPKFVGFSEGLTVVVLWSAFSSKKKAEAAVAKVKPCVPDAFIKQARYTGE